MQASEPEPPGSPTWFARLVRQRSLLALAAATVVAAFIVRAVVATFFAIPAPSMSPTIEPGDRVLVNRLSYVFGDIQRGQVVVFDTPPNHDSDEDALIKRVMALPGETIQFRDGEVFIGAHLAVEPYLAQQSSTRRGPRAIPGCADGSPFDGCVVPDDHVFVLGDNRMRSEDSRLFGPVAIDSIIGRATSRVWPPNDLGRI